MIGREVVAVVADLALWAALGEVLAVVLWWLWCEVVAW